MKVRKIAVGKAIKLVWLGAILVCLLALAAFCVFYLAKSHQYLVEWFIQMHPCIYRGNSFSVDFFTPSVKSQGNQFCWIALTLLTGGVIYTLLQYKRKYQPAFTFQFRPNITDAVTLAILLVYCCGIWAYGNAQSRPAFDEVFSAMNVAGIHPFQGASYYMLPNNHLLFNLLNNLLSPKITDRVFSGRVLSLTSYLIFGSLVFFGSKLLKFNRLLSLLIALLAVSQFFVWGFSFQARGYELYLTAESVLLFSAFRYIATDDRKWLYPYMLAMVVGYFCMPTFLYIHVGSLLFFGLYQLSFKLKNTKFWSAQALGFCIVFLCYLPVLCFSGEGAIVNNHYVAPMATYKTFSAFCTWMFPFFQNYLPHLFSMPVKGGVWFSALTCAPLLLLAAPKKSWHFVAGLCHLSVWVTLLAFIIAMKRVPFERNLIGHYSLTLLALVALLHWLCLIFLRKIAFIQRAALATCLLAGISVSLVNNRTLLVDTLYEYNVNEIYNQLRAELQKIPTHTTVGCSDEAFYYAYLCRELGLNTKTCDAGNEIRFIKHESESIPDSLARRYNLESNTNGMQIYKLNR